MIRGGGSDQISGLGGNDAICEDPGDEWLDGGPGEDLLAGGAGADTIDGGAGLDPATCDDFPAEADLKLGTAFGGGAQRDTLLEVENLAGSDHAGRLTGDARGQRDPRRP